MENKEFVCQLITWYSKNKRDLPWRETQNPYIIWLSEILLQQTRVDQGLPYFYKFVDNYPDVNKLANAEEREVLRLWEGLGYYSRARNLHATAKLIVEKYSGIFPQTYKELLKLKGVGPYTAAAIASFSFNESVAVVDGNVYRVLSRVFGIDDDIRSPSGIKKFRELANLLIPKKDPATYNQAIMEFGALHCVPAKPKCEDCPVSAQCYAFSTNAQSLLPVKNKKIVKKNRHFNYLAFRWKDKILMKERKSKDIWQGLYEFYNNESSEILDPGKLLNKLPSKELTVVKSSEVMKQILTHQVLFCQGHIINVNSKTAFNAIKGALELKEFSINQINDLPKPVLIQRFLKQCDF
ncbi:A/G-specific adenine glycosylase [Sporocytophaga myxococcoides]|uniref:A/G-specific adenine glycosylase n=1 Tax=Sporocytophaga myxococcoides TaxID=153721 RepID=UPI0004114A1D|nr:A/G-specific adenine glycosylase [Sporocytophaga myxococcoides]